MFKRSGTFLIFKRLEHKREQNQLCIIYSHIKFITRVTNYVSLQTLYSQLESMSLILAFLEKSLEDIIHLKCILLALTTRKPIRSAPLFLQKQIEK